MALKEQKDITSEGLLEKLVQVSRVAKTVKEVGSFFYGPDCCGRRKR